MAPGGRLDTSFPTFAWDPVAPASGYRLQLIAGDNRVVLDRPIPADELGCQHGDACTVSAPRALPPGAYRWRLRSLDENMGAASKWSPWQLLEIPPLEELGSGLDARPTNTTCRLPAPPSPFGLRLEEVYPRLPNPNTVILLSSPVDERWLMVEKDGFVYSFDASDPDARSVDLVIDISDRALPDTGETGLLGMAFHPEFPEDPRAFLFYTNLVDGEYESYLSEFTSPDEGLTFDPDSERNILTITGHATHNHKGGTVLFGPDGYLYAGLGDGGDPWSSQDPHSLLGSLIRIDIDAGDPYAIPPDNPFADGVDGAPEVFAYGFRNPWRWSFDRLTGDIWLTDVGHTLWEEINVVERAGNYGWPIFEGPDCQATSRCDDPGLIAPIHAYPHDETGGFVIVGGFVYRGSELPELQGRFIFADGSDRVWALFFDDDGQPSPVLLVDGGLDGPILRSLFEDDDGEIYLTKPRLLWQFVPDERLAEEPFPELLSDTGCFASEDARIPGEGLIPYGVNNAFWTDGAAKSRWLAIPDGTRVEQMDDGDFAFPPGTVLVKEFRLGARRVETRLFARHDDGKWAGYSYAWNEAQTDAELVDTFGEQLDVDGQPYTIPSRNQCLTCHTSAAGRSLGLEHLQQNGDFTYPGTGRTANQLDTFELIGLFRSQLPDATENLPSLPAIDAASASFDERARAYLHSNCSSCHRPGGTGRGPGDLRFQPLADMNICDVRPRVGDFGIPDPRLLAPGEPERSVLSARLQALGPGAMPPIGKNLVDIEAAAVLDEFIADLSECPQPSKSIEAHHRRHW